MTKSRARKSKARTSPRKSTEMVPLIDRFYKWRWTILKIVIIAAALGAGAYFFSEILQAVGFGFILALIWIITAGFVIRQKQTRRFLGWWNFCLGAFLLSLAVWGVLALLHPSATLTGVNLEQTSLGGNAGKYFIGNQGAGAHPVLRLAFLIPGGVIAIIPQPSFIFLKRLGVASRIIMQAAIDGLRKFLSKLGHGMVRLYGMLQRPSPSPQPLIPVAVTADITTTNTDILETPDTNGIQLPLPDIPDNKDKTTTEKVKPQSGSTIKKHLPGLELLDKPAEMVFATADNEKRAKLIVDSLRSYGVEASVVQINPGPSVTQFGIEPGWDIKYKRIPERDAEGKIKFDKDGIPIEKKIELSRTRVKVERITALSNNLALALATPNIRIEAPVPGKPVVGIEVPNVTSSVVRIRGVIESPTFQKIRSRSKLALALGNGAAGEPIAADLTKMPHLLIAGTTGSGKTVCINSIISCLLMCNAPEDMRLMLVDPKRVELVSFNGVPHLISPVVVEVDQAIESLRKLIREMETRFSKFAAIGVRNIEGHNKSPLVTEAMPYLVVVVDELADLMMTAAEVVEPTICRLAQLARATGIHLILATQRPSVDVVTGLIKANFPTRISFAVASLVDSRTILDCGGAEKLLGQGDMLYVPPDANKPKRLRGCYVSDQEINTIVKFWKDRHDIYPAHLDDAVAQAFAALKIEDEVKHEDPLMASARRIAKDHSHISTSLLQRKLHVGYPRAARIMDTLEDEGIVVRGEGEVRESLEFDDEEGA